MGVSGKAKDPFTAALEALRRQLRFGRFVMGEPLTISDLAHELGLSATPVREALSRLAGEGLIEDRRGRGYFAPRLDVADAVGLYKLRRLYLVEALAGSTSHHATISLALMRQPEDDDDASGAIAGFFEKLVLLAENRALFDAYKQISDRLAPIVRVEDRVLDLAADVISLEQALPQDAVALSRAIATMHKERQDRSHDLVRTMRASTNIDSL